MRSLCCETALLRDRHAAGMSERSLCCETSLDRGVPRLKKMIVGKITIEIAIVIAILLPPIAPQSNFLPPRSQGKVFKFQNHTIHHIQFGTLMWCQQNQLVSTIK